MLYTSAFLAERYAGIRTFLEGKVCNHAGLLPGLSLSSLRKAADTYNAFTYSGASKGLAFAGEERVEGFCGG